MFFLSVIDPIKHAEVCAVERGSVLSATNGGAL